LISIPSIILSYDLMIIYKLWYMFKNCEMSCVLRD